MMITERKGCWNLFIGNLEIANYLKFALALINSSKLKLWFRIIYMKCPLEFIPEITVRFYGSARYSDMVL